MSNRTYFVTVFLAVSTAATLQFAPSAQAAPTRSPLADAAPTSVRVRVDDLDLSTPAGAKVALKRVRRAAGLVCGGEEEGYKGLAYYAHFQGCVKTTVRYGVSLPGAQRPSDPNATLLRMVLAANH
jgi:UrcA family protein